jgi:hypothetical protein
VHAVVYLIVKKCLVMWCVHSLKRKSDKITLESSIGYQKMPIRFLFRFDESFQELFHQLYLCGYIHLESLVFS